MYRPARAASETVDASRLIASDDGAIAFAVRRMDHAVDVERTQPLAGIGKLSHMMRFDSVYAFDHAYASDVMRFRYPHVYWRLRQAVEALLDVRN